MSNFFSLSAFQKYFYEYITHYINREEIPGFGSHLLSIRKAIPSKRNRGYEKKSEIVADILINIASLKKYNIHADKVLSAIQHENHDIYRFITKWKLIYPFITISLNRALVTSRIMKSILQQKEHFGLLGNVDQKKILIFHSFSKEETESAEALRFKVLFQNIQSVLKSNGYEVCTLVNSENSTVPIEEKKLENLLGKAQTILKDKTKTLNLVEKELKERSSYVEPFSANSQLARKHHLEFSDSDLLDILSSIPIKNNEKMKQLLTSVAVLENYICNNSIKSTDVCIHLSSVSQSFTSQQINVLWNLLVLQNLEHEIQNIHCNVGPVAIQDNTQQNFNFNRYVQESIRNATKQKVNKSEEEMETMMVSVYDCCMKFCLLASNISRTLKINIKDENQTHSFIKTGSFVMYNYARLKAIINHFLIDVENNKYPPLPPIDDLDFTLLKTEEEWNLLFNYICDFPVMMENVVSSLLNSSMTSVNFQLHKIYLFLKCLSHDISNYYSRVHILSEPLSHLMPQLHCRIYLLTSILQIMENSFRCLGIIPLAEM